MRQALRALLTGVAVVVMVLVAIVVVPVLIIGAAALIDMAVHVLAGLAIS